MHPEATWVPIALFVCITATIVGLPIARALARRMDRDADLPAVPRDVAARLERMEHAIDSIALEVERIAEGQRFTTKLLAERGTRADASLPAAGGRLS